jgi:pimeloyl-ACP methyl ester carboxylesterase
MPEAAPAAASTAARASAPAARLAQRPTLVLLHGVGGNAAGLAPLSAAFQELGWPALAWSQPGYDGTPLVEPYDLAACAQVLARWLAGRRAGRVILVGHSMGGMLAQAVSAQLDRLPPCGEFEIVGLVLAHTSPAFGNTAGEFQQRFIASRTRPLDEGKSMHDMAASLVPGLMAPTASNAAKAAGVAMMAAVPPQTYRLAIAALTAFDAREHLARIRVPVLCLAAEFDTTSAPAVLQRMAERIRGADYQCLPGLGHLAPIENPQRWAAAVATWCGRRIPV